MASARKRPNEIEAGSIRRIGFRHAVMLPARQAQLVDMNAINVELGRAKERLATFEAKRDAAAARVAELTAQKEAFDSLPIERDDEDPTVPQEAPRTSQEVRRAIEAATAEREAAERAAEEAEAKADEEADAPRR